MHLSMRSCDSKKLGYIALLAVTFVGLAVGGYAKSKRVDARLFPKFDLPPMPLTFPAIAPLVVAMPPIPALGLCGGSISGPFYCGCGLIPIIDLRRESVLPDPVSALGAAYLKCRMVKAAILDPEVPVEFYPAGYFGRWAQDGVLVTEQFVLSDEMELRRIFTLLTETMAEPADLFDCWLDNPASWASIGDFRRETGFTTMMTVEFVGEVPLRVEFSQKQERVLIQAGERWEIFALDRWSAKALRDFLIEKSGRSPSKGY